jgi:hypothetical protein
MKDDVREIAEWFMSRACAKGDCYRCWQVGRETRATCVVEYNIGTPHAWKSESCNACAKRDTAEGSPGRSRILSN